MKVELKFHRYADVQPINGQWVLVCEPRLSGDDKFYVVKRSGDWWNDGQSGYLIRGSDLWACLPHLQD